VPQVLKELMRHESIETTMNYYLGYNAQLTADAFWSVYDQRRSQHVASSAVAPQQPSASRDGSPAAD